MSEIEKKTLAQLIRDYPQGLNNKKWSGYYLSKNPSISPEAIEDNPNIEWDIGELLRNYNLDVSFRLKLLKSQKYQVRYIEKGIILDLPILKHIIELEYYDNLAEYITRLVHNDNLKLESVQWLYNSEYRDKAPWGVMINQSREIFQWAVFNYESPEDINISYAIYRKWITPGIADYLIEQLQVLDGILPLLCLSSDPIARLEQLDEDAIGILDIDDMLYHSPSAEVTELLFDLYPDVIDSSLVNVHRLTLDYNLIMNLLEDPHVTDLWRPYLIHNKNITSDIIYQFLTNPNILKYLEEKVACTYVVDGYYSNNLYIDPDIASIIWDQLKDDEDYQYLQPIIELPEIKWKLKHINNKKLSPFIDDIKLLISVPKYDININKISWTGSINLELMDFLSAHSGLARRMNWDLLSENADQDMIANYPKLPWDKTTLSKRSYQPSIRSSRTKRAR